MHLNTLIAISIALYCSCMSLYDRDLCEVYNVPVGLDLLSPAAESSLDTPL